MFYLIAISISLDREVLKLHVAIETTRKKYGAQDWRCCSCICF